ncbi:MAG: aspartate kinase [Desulfomonile tiedjei]|uniref:Aspartokinase n=1 Tax=Desulfomonile tiedjei TaxID=2358 RepID=A0A9D6V557_9BACT|nr:aspartate kinase [Desulfomonile tiedjei]
MALIVQKYGGTSVGDLERIANVARKVAATKDRGDDVVVVVSAMAGETDRLIGLAKKVSPLPNEREMDVLLSTGEQVTIALLAMTLESMGYKARSYCGWQIPLVTDPAYGAARITAIKKEAILEDVKNGHIIVVAGFQGVDDKGSITTLGRGGSDTSAVAVAAALNADLCEIFTDVDGVYTTDPNITSKACKIRKIAYEEMLEMASAGAKVLYIRAVEFAMRYRVPVVVRSSFSDNDGTLVTEESSDMEKESVRAVTCNTKEAKITISGVEDKPGIASRIFSSLADANIVVDMIIQNASADGKTDISFTLPESDLQKGLEICGKFKEQLEATQISGASDIAKVSIIGLGMRSHSGVAAKMFTALSKEGINIEMISTSEIKISCVINQKYAELAVRTLHDVFELEKSC